jgi:hypothetical protein
VPGSRASASGRQLESTVLSSYKAELREFRALQEELEPWTEAFREQHKCKPTLADVQATREPSRNPTATACQQLQAGSSQCWCMVLRRLVSP